MLTLRLKITPFFGSLSAARLRRPFPREAGSLAPPVTPRRILRVLLAGFTLVTLLLLAAGFVAVTNIRAIKSNAASLVQEQFLTTRLIDEVQREQGTLSSIFYHLEQDPESINRDQILTQLREADTHIERIVASVQANSDPLWEELRSSSQALSSEARRLLGTTSRQISISHDLLRYHQQVLVIVASLITASHEKAQAAQTQIKRRSEELIGRSLLLLGTSLAMALFCALLTVRTTTGLFRRMEWQSGELSRVSWHMLENQESTARRFSHELHDELGQALTAIKVNLAALQSSAAGRILTLQSDPGERVEDCLELVDGAIRNVREMSQLLHPTILDDFGLAEGLRWLTERFTERTGIQVDFAARFTGRLPDETETHLFRICQEALTNVARHSGATHVRIRLETEGGLVVLSVRDDGCGLESRRASERHGLGMVAMRARAHSVRGELEVRPAGAKGVLVVVKAPIESPRHAEKDSNHTGG